MAHVFEPGEARNGADAPGHVDPLFWRDRRVLVTGHTGFKGAWLSLWLQTLGAHVTGLSLPKPPSEPSLYQLAGVKDGMAGEFACDVRDPHAVAGVLLDTLPEVVIHMAAQPLVRRSFAAPRETYETNVLGTVNLFEAVRACGGVRALVNVTSDKCYESSESPHGHREQDPLGGHDPYSSSKAAAEIITSVYRRSFFSDPSGPRLASARAGNVIGGGDWGEDRLIPDILRAARSGETLRLRYPHAMRPWQHVLNPLSGYLLLAQRLCESPDHARAWNFGPHEHDAITVSSLVQRFSELWPGGIRWTADDAAHPPETHNLKLDSSQAREQLGWAPPLELERGIAATVAWYEASRDGESPRALTLSQIAEAQASIGVD
ncbi:MAG TPA: CDP-glucose 4,6-dehydratase [Solirubrobacteraceae bacterium]|nr:CDP-glucose 4,6-dehydratase [Solirubrobacteraceae bacterium]